MATPMLLAIGLFEGFIFIFAIISRSLPLVYNCAVDRVRVCVYEFECFACLFPSQYFHRLQIIRQEVIKILRFNEESCDH